MPRIYIHPLFHTAPEMSSDLSVTSHGPMSLDEVLRGACGNDKQMLFKMMDEQGGLRPHVAVFVGDEHCKYLGGLDAEVAPDDEVSVFPALSGG